MGSVMKLGFQHFVFYWQWMIIWMEPQEASAFLREKKNEKENLAIGWFCTCGVYLCRAKLCNKDFFQIYLQEICHIISIKSTRFFSFELYPCISAVNIHYLNIYYTFNTQLRLHALPRNRTHFPLVLIPSSSWQWSQKNSVTCYLSHHILSMTLNYNWGIFFQQLSHKN